MAVSHLLVMSHPLVDVGAPLGDELPTSSKLCSQDEAFIFCLHWLLINYLLAEFLNTAVALAMRPRRHSSYVIFSPL